ncbi:MAG: hypothetical protein QOI96_797 [Verrucomicrobiota bacterium]
MFQPAEAVAQRQLEQGLPLAPLQPGQALPLVRLRWEPALQRMRLQLFSRPPPQFFSRQPLDFCFS